MGLGLISYISDERLTGVDLCTVYCFQDLPGFRPTGCVMFLDLADRD